MFSKSTNEFDTLCKTTRNPDDQGLISCPNFRLSDLPEVPLPPPHLPPDRPAAGFVNMEICKPDRRVCHFFSIKISKLYKIEITVTNRRYVQKTL